MQRFSRREVGGDGQWSRQQSTGGWLTWEGGGVGSVTRLRLQRLVSGVLCCGRCEAYNRPSCPYQDIMSSQLRDLSPLAQLPFVVSSSSSCEAALWESKPWLTRVASIWPIRCCPKSAKQIAGGVNLVWNISDLSSLGTATANHVPSACRNTGHRQPAKLGTCRSSAAAIDIIAGLCENGWMMRAPVQV